MTSPTAFGFLAHAYDGMHLMAMAVKQAGSTDGDKLRQALENLQGTYDGAMKTYTKPFSPTGHDALLVGDYKWAHWQDGKLVPYADDVTRAGKVSAGPGRRGAIMMATLLQALVSGLAVGGAYALVALGFSITFTTTRTLNFGHGEFVSVGAFVGVGPCSCWPANRPPRPPSRGWT